jgi:hypothetical protein
MSLLKSIKCQRQINTNSSQTIPKCEKEGIHLYSVYGASIMLIMKADKVTIAAIRNTVDYYLK